MPPLGQPCPNDFRTSRPPLSILTPSSLSRGSRDNPEADFLPCVPFGLSTAAVEMGVGERAVVAATVRPCCYLPNAPTASRRMSGEAFARRKLLCARGNDAFVRHKAQEGWSCRYRTYAKMLVHSLPNAASLVASCATSVTATEKC